MVFAVPSGWALSSAVWSVFRVVALLESAGFLVLKVNIAAMLARWISAWPNGKRLSDAPPKQVERTDAGGVG